MFVVVALVIVLAVVLLLLLLHGSGHLEDHMRWKGPRQTLVSSPTVLRAGGPIKDHLVRLFGYVRMCVRGASRISSQLYIIALLYSV